METKVPEFVSTVSKTIKCDHCSKLFVNQQRVVCAWASGLFWKYRSFSLSRHKKINSKPFNEISQEQENVVEDQYINNLSRSHVFVIHRFWAICRSVARNFLEFCMESPCWWTTLVHQYGGRKSTKTSGVDFAMKALTFHRETVHMCTNTSPNILETFKLGES